MDLKKELVVLAHLVKKKKKNLLTLQYVNFGQWSWPYPMDRRKGKLV